MPPFWRKCWGVGSQAGVDGGGILGRQRQNSEIVVQHIVGHAESGADHGVAAGSGRISEADAGREVGGLRLGRFKGDHAGHVGDLVEGLQPLAFRHRRIFITQPQVDGQVGADAPVVVGIKVEGDLIAVVRTDGQTALRQVVGAEVVQILVEVGIIVIAAHALGELLGSDEVSAVETELEIMAALDPAQVVDQLVSIEDGGLRAIGIGANLNSQIVVDGDVGEGIQTWIGRGGNRNFVVVAVVAEPEFIGQAGSEGVILGQGEQVLVGGRHAKELRQVGGVVDGGDAVADHAAAQLVGRGDVVIHAVEPGVLVGVIGRGQRQGADRDGDAAGRALSGAIGCATGRGNAGTDQRRGRLAVGATGKYCLRILRLV